MKKPNILLITFDDIGAVLGCYGDPHARTPHLDTLAREGVLFHRGYTTHPSCSPSRSSILTGLYPHQNGQIGLARPIYRVKEEIPLLPNVLRASGYRTGILGKLHVAPDEAFEFEFNHKSMDPPTPLDAMRRDSAAYAKFARQFMEQDDERPFFLYLNFIDPHRDFVDQVKGLPEKPRGAEEVATLPFLAMDTPELRREAAGYQNCIERVDAGVGMVMEALRASGYEDDTLVFVVADHGPPFTRAKTTCYEAGLRVTMMARWPGRVEAGVDAQELVSVVDIMPTVLEAAGIPAPPEQAGRSLWPLFKGERTTWRETVCGEYTAHTPQTYFPRRSIRDDRYKLIINLLQDRPNPVGSVDGCGAWAEVQKAEYDGTPVRAIYDRYDRPPPVELYDLQEDPNEFVDLADDPAYQEIRDRLSRALREWQEETNDPLQDPAELDALTRWHDALPENQRR